MLPPPAIIRRFTGLSIFRSSRITCRICRLSAMQNTSSPARTTVSPSGMIAWSPRKIAVTRASTDDKCWRRSLSG